MTEITIDLADILERKYPRGFHAPADIPIDTFLEFADDDWEHRIDLAALLDDQRLAPVTFGVADVKERRPDLTDEQAWEVAQAARDDFARHRRHLDFLESTADAMFPTARRQALDRVYVLRFRLREHLDGHESADRVDRWERELTLIESLARKLPDRVTDDPAALGLIAAALDDLETAITNPGEPA
jgi:hypothetical protein